MFRYIIQNCLYRSNQSDMLGIGMGQPLKIVGHKKLFGTFLDPFPLHVVPWQGLDSHVC